MEAKNCSRRSRKNIKAGIKRKLLLHSRFGCSICGAIPIVFHHIEEWSEKFSNDEKYIIPICDKCHRGIHGSRGSIFTKEELYKIKAKPKGPTLLKDKLPLERKRDYSFFIGSNFISHGERSSLIAFPGKYHLISIDLSSGVLKLNVLAGLKNNKPLYLIKDNELIIETRGIWKMNYSGNSLKIWRQSGSKKNVFIDLIIKEKIIIIKEMNTKFNGKLFRIYKLRAAQKRQVSKISKLIKECEKYYLLLLTKLDKKIDDAIKDAKTAKMVKDSQKETLKFRLKQSLKNYIIKELKWDPLYSHHILDKELEKSQVLRKQKFPKVNYPSQLEMKTDEKIERIKKKYKKEFKEVEGVITEYGGIQFTRNIMF